MLSIWSIAAVLVVGGATARAHKPITSRYTYNEDVFPILSARCGRCHVDGGVTPMSLMTHADAVPWAESIRAELLAGHMPPWKVLTPRELDVLLTWVTGGTPIGAAEKAPDLVAPLHRWGLGTPDLVLPLPAVGLPASVTEDVKEFRLAIETREPRWLRAVDLMPGTPAVVRSATISIRDASVSDASDGRSERVLGLWQPGDDPIALKRGMAFRLPAAAALIVRIRYKKTWRDERREMSDESRIGLYFASEPSTEVRALTLIPNAANEGPRPAVQELLTQTLDDDFRALAIYPDPRFPRARVRVVAARPDGVRVELIAFRARPGWARRYWFAEPIDLPRGTQLEMRIEPDDTLLAPDAPRIPPGPIEPSTSRVTLDVLPRR